MASKTAAKTSRDIQQEVTDTIIAQLEAGVRPWRQSWVGCGVPTNRSTGKAYRGMNVMLLWIKQAVAAYPTAEWMTFIQARDMKAGVRKGETGTTLVKWNPIKRTDKVTGEEVIGGMVPNAFTVFNVAQIDGLPEVATVDGLPESERVAHAESFFAAQGISLAHGGDRAFYRRSEDRVQMPDFAAFESAVAYYGTLGHEAIHWTGHESRLAREFGSFGDEKYAFEELVAELGSAFVTASLGLEPAPRRDHADYVANWLQALRGDKRYVFAAASKAQKAADWLLERAAAAGVGPLEAPEVEGESVEAEPLRLAA